MKLERLVNRLGGNSIGTKIILPYLLLTLMVAGVGAFIITNLIASSLQERFDNQLLDAGRVVSETLVDYEAVRLQVLRAVAGTTGVPTSLAAGDTQQLAALVPQIIANNSQTDAVSLVNEQGLEVYGWQRLPIQEGGEARSGTDFSQVEAVSLVLQGVTDDIGDKRAFLGETPTGPMIFTVGPVLQDGTVVGAVLIGTDVQRMVVRLTETAVARVTLYNRAGDVIDTSLGGGSQQTAALLQGSPQQYETVIDLLQASPEQYRIVTTTADREVPLHQIEVLNQTYLLAYGDWRLRNQSFGLFSVALPSNFIIRTAALSRNSLSLVFSVATIGVFVLGYAIAHWITRPILRLVSVSSAVAQGDLNQRTGIERGDEIGTLAASFDTMTQHLAQRNRQLLEQASELKAILHSIADGIIVFDNQNQIISSNPAAEQILHLIMYGDTAPGQPANGTVSSPTTIEQLLQANLTENTNRYQVGQRVFSASVAPVKTPTDDELGHVVVLRDVTREAEAEGLKDGFITNISHELRTPLTAIKGYADLLIATGAGSLSEQHLKFAQIVNDNANNLIAHVEKLIDISQIQRGALQLQQRDASFNELTKNTVNAWQERMQQSGLSLSLELDDGVMTVYCDPVRFVWALDNLLNNAHDYTLAGGGVHVRTYQENGNACLTVTDTGVGISTADQPYLFTRFFRAENELTFNVPGIGLDLFIVRSIIEGHGGQVWVESELNMGSTFGLALPLSKKSQ